MIPPSQVRKTLTGQTLLYFYQLVLKLTLNAALLRSGVLPPNMQTSLGTIWGAGKTRKCMLYFDKSFSLSFMKPIEMSKEKLRYVKPTLFTMLSVLSYGPIGIV